jgi:hypothetical protein
VDLVSQFPTRVLRRCAYFTGELVCFRWANLALGGTSTAWELEVGAGKEKKK